jgi:hypothetical protein
VHSAPHPAERTPHRPRLTRSRASGQGVRARAGLSHWLSTQVRPARRPPSGPAFSPQEARWVTSTVRGHAVLQSTVEGPTAHTHSAGDPPIA